MAHEEWRDVVGFEKRYQISNMGRVKSLPKQLKGYITKERIMKFKKDKGGHLFVSLRKNDAYHTRFVHKMVLESFIEPKPKDMEGCHNDGNPANNNLSNLRWDTHKNNEADKIKHRTRLFGESHPSTKITMDTVIKIKENIRNKIMSRKDFCSKYNVSIYTYSDIQRKRRWIHLEEFNEDKIEKNK